MRHEEPKAVGIWIRVSTEDQARGESPEHHERRARLYAEMKGWGVLELYDLSGVSGKSVVENAEAKRMMDDIRSGHITGLIFSKLARLARNTRELLDFAEFFQEHNADLISLQESIDTASPAGRLFYTMIAAMAQWEREEIADRVRASVPIRAKLGKQTGGQASFGYQWLDGGLVPHPDEAPVRKLIYQLYAEHKRKKTVARILNERGYRTRKGAKFSDTTITRLLSDPTAKGIHRANYTRKKDRNDSWEHKPEEEWVIREVEPIVSEELWDQCNAILLDQMKGRKPSRKSPKLFTGLAFCTCGQKMYVPSNTPKYVCYSCRNKIPIVDLEALFQEQLKEFFFSPQELENHLAEADTAIHETQEQLALFEREKQKLQADMDRLYDLYSAGGLDVEGFAKRNRPMEERLRQIEEQIPEHQAKVDILKIHHLSSEEVFSEARDLYSRWDSLPFEERRSIVETIVEEIIIGDQEVEINLCYLPSQGTTDILATPQQGFIAATS